jgi:hypothetical protein
VDSYHALYLGILEKLYCIPVSFDSFVVVPAQVALDPECVKFSRKKISETCYQIAWIVSIDTHNSIS